MTNPRGSDEQRAAAELFERFQEAMPLEEVGQAEDCSHTQRVCSRPWLSSEREGIQPWDKRRRCGKNHKVPDIVLTTLNARFVHSAFGLRYLLANMGDLEPRTAIREFSLGLRERDMVEAVLAENPKIVGLSVYIWNVVPMTAVCLLLKAIRPELIVVIGGPEVSFEWEGAAIFEAADYLVRGEGDLAFASLCREVLAGERPAEKVRQGGLPLLESLTTPYPRYSDFDLEHGRIIYVEASRGCPFRCHFCLSSLDKSVRAFPLEPFLQEMEGLLGRGVRHFKFVDRTFNLKAETSERILGFFLERYTEGLFLHFEMIPDRLPETLKPLISAFPPGVLQFEVGIQSFDAEVCARIGRRQNFQALRENLTFLAAETGVHVHADLIAGLPGEDLEMFGRGFDQLVALKPAEIQVGILKRLKGTPMTLADPCWQMTYADTAPYEVIHTSALTFQELQRLQRFSRYWDMVANSGKFPHALPHLLDDSPFRNFLAFSDWLHQEVGATHGIAHARLEKLVSSYLEGRLEPVGIGPTETARPKLPKRQARRIQT